MPCISDYLVTIGISTVLKNTEIDLIKFTLASTL